MTPAVGRTAIIGTTRAASTRLSVLGVPPLPSTAKARATDDMALPMVDVA